jgi:protein-disulfide isomerase
MHQPSRRTFLAAASAGVAGLAGCLGGGGDDEGRDCSGEQRSVEVPAAGDPDSEVTVAAYEDFECPGCREYALNVYPQIEREYVEPGTVAYEHRDLPIPVEEEWSWRVPNAALAVLEDAGGEAYYGFVHEVYQHQGDYTEDIVGEVATNQGADEGVVREAIEEEPFCEQLNESRAEALDRGVESTPTVFVNDQRLEAPSAEELAEAIEEELG